LASGHFDRSLFFVPSTTPSIQQRERYVGAVTVDRVQRIGQAELVDGIERVVGIVLVDRVGGIAGIIAIKG